MRLESMGLMLGEGSIIDEGFPCVCVLFGHRSIGVPSAFCGKGRIGLREYRYRLLSLRKARDLEVFGGAERYC